MCHSRNSTKVIINNKFVRIDKCMGHLIEFINQQKGIKTVACCCGHHIYPMSIIVRDKTGFIWDLMSIKKIPRIKRFYRKDKDGYYYIPEVMEGFKNV